MKEKIEKWNSKYRTAEILAVFTKHNFYSNGFTPEEMRTTLEDLGPTYIKIGQIMSSRTDFLPASYCKELEKLRSRVKPLEAETVREIIEEETGRKIEEIYAEFNDEPLGSASIAQAHYGVLKDGTRVVTKVQRPYIAEMVKKDFVLLKKFATLANIVTETEAGTALIDLRSVIDELEKVSNEELDFHVEADHSRVFREKCIDDETSVSCPIIIDELTTTRILTQTFVDGFPLSKREKLEEFRVDREAVGRALVKNYLHQVLDAGIFHGDPHQGNIMLCGTVPYWIDFGIIGHISQQNIGIIQDMIMAVLLKDPDQLTNIILSMGITSGNINKSKLTEDLGYLIERYVAVKDLSNINMGVLMEELMSILTKYQIKMPSEFTLLVRSLVTFEGVIGELCPELNLFDLLTHKMVERMKESFDLRSKLTSLLRDVAATGADAMQMPGAVISLLRNLSKGRMKIGFELTGYDELMQKMQLTVRNIAFALFACVIFAGSCILCTTDIQPQAYGIPFIAMIGFVTSVALGIYTIIKMSSKK
ncbi:MAG: AarF/ABC1/UbiB kinase family protein [Ruminococcus sp.]|nr:AarF/ABC1/UbiB kinase family protein [Ruminococcus sp.]